jgi:enoyl-CoA hydratase/carnithine racemase
MPFNHALILESLGYSTLLASDGFRQWRQKTSRRLLPNELPGRVVLAREQGALRVHLSRPASRNAFDALMRDELVAALEFALEDPEHSAVILDGDGSCFSAGGDLGEFGSAADSGVAHAVRVLQSPAKLVHALADRMTVRLHSACIGAGIEVAAAARRVVAHRDTYCRLPEMSMGLIPGAGGTATISRRIGRHRTCYMAMTGADIDSNSALEWGLIDQLD